MQATRTAICLPRSRLSLSNPRRALGKTPELGPTIPEGKAVVILCALGSQLSGPTRQRTRRRESNCCFASHLG